MTEIESIKEQSVNKIHKATQSKEFLNRQDLQDILTYWKLLDRKENVNTHILSNVNTNEEVLSFLSKFQTNDRSKFTFDFDELEEYHGLNFYETKLNEVLLIENLNPEIKEFCEIFLNESREYKKNS